MGGFGLTPESARCLVVHTRETMWQETILATETYAKATLHQRAMREVKR